MKNSKKESNYRKFLQGTFLIKGWNARGQEILQSVPEKDRERMESLLRDLGEKIGREWSRDKAVRKIETSLLQKWGKELQDAQKISSEELVKRIEKLDQEVDEILS